MNQELHPASNKYTKAPDAPVASTLDIAVTKSSSKTIEQQDDQDGVLLAGRNDGISLAFEEPLG